MWPSQPLSMATELTAKQLSSPCYRKVMMIVRELLNLMRRKVGGKVMEIDETKAIRMSWLERIMDGPGKSIFSLIKDCGDYVSFTCYTKA